jgi:hypothetical protein
MIEDLYQLYKLATEPRSGWKDQGGGLELGWSLLHGILYVTFDRSKGKRDWLRNFQVRGVMLSTFFGRAIYACRGDADAYKSMMNFLWATIREQTPKSVCYLGVSQGGALAQLAFIWHKLQHVKSRVWCVTFGTKRTIKGRSALGPSLKANLDNMIHVINPNDPIPKIPIGQLLGKQVILRYSWPWYRFSKNHNGYAEALLRHYERGV